MTETEETAERETTRNRDATVGDDVALRTDGLTKQFSGFTAVDAVDLRVERGEFRSVIGPNGAGKTTLFNLISGAITPTAGSITLLGADVTDAPPTARVARGLARSFQLTTVFAGLSVRENVRLAAQAAIYDDLSTLQTLFGRTDDIDAVTERTASVLDRVRLTEFAETQASALSYGERRRLELGLVLATDPEVVLLDEPTAGMSGEETLATIDLIEDVLSDKTLVLVEHDVDLVMQLSDRITVLNHGSPITTGTPDEVADDEAVQRAYLGGYDG
jgi:branched-chain amino acid transport system ATP-binding protein